MKGVVVMRPILPALVTIVAAAAIVSAADGTAKGTMTVNGKTSTLAYAYARAIPDPFDKAKTATEVILSDVPLDKAAVADDPFALIHLADAGKAHAILFEINASNKIVSVALRDAAFTKASPSGNSSSYTFDPGTVTASTIAGKLYCTEPRTAFGETWTFSATFSAPIVPRPAPASKSAVAADNPVAMAAVAFLKAAHAGNVAAMKKLVTPAGVAQLDSADGKMMLEIMKETSPANPKITSVEMQGPDAATAKIVEESSSKDGSSTSTITLKLVRIGGQWKVDTSR
jgi:hypothetical protein